MTHFKISLIKPTVPGIATGTIVYVVFFEIIPKAKMVGGTGKQVICRRRVDNDVTPIQEPALHQILKRSHIISHLQHIIAMVLGFAIFLPSLYFREFIFPSLYQYTLQCSLPIILSNISNKSIHGLLLSPFFNQINMIPMDEIATIIPDQTMSTRERMSRHAPHLILCI